jgi:hypothetical protein
VKVYVVETGEYSDYRVDAICDSRKGAEAVAAHMKARGETDARVRAVSMVVGEQFFACWSVHAYIDPHTGEVVVTDGYEYGIAGDAVRPNLDGPKMAPVGRWVVNGFGTNRDAVKKACRDRLMQKKAELEGLA